MYSREYKCRNMDGTYPWFDYGTWLSTPPEPWSEPDVDEDEAYDRWKDEQVQPMDRERYDDNAYWRKRYLELCYELGEIVNEQQDKIISLTNENRRLKRENWNMKQTKRRRR